MNIVVTGASAGIGAALAAILAQKGHKLVMSARRQAELDDIARRIGAKAVVADVTKRAEVEKLRDAAIAELGHIDVWINNAGRGITKPALKLDDADVDEMMLVNVKSVLYCMQAIAPHFIERKRGHILNVSSGLAKAPLAPIRSAYSASKAAMNSLSGSVRAELAQVSPDIRVSVVMPGIVATDFARNTRGADPNAARPNLPPGMVIQTAEEAADAIAAVVEKPADEAYTGPHVPGSVKHFEASLRS
jgi:short-subunit dehydrogenase